MSQWLSRNEHKHVYDFIDRLSVRLQFYSPSSPATPSLEQII